MGTVDGCTPRLRAETLRKPTQALIPILGCVATVTLLGACGGAGPTATPAKSTPPTSSVSATTTFNLPALPATLASFADSWGSPTGRVDIDNTGHGHFEYQDPSRCPQCRARVEFPYSTVDFTLTSVSNGVASGSVTETSNPQNYAVGQPVTAKLVAAKTLMPGRSGELLDMSIGGFFCNSTSIGLC